MYHYIGPKSYFMPAGVDVKLLEQSRQVQWGTVKLPMVEYNLQGNLTYFRKIETRKPIWDSEFEEAEIDPKFSGEPVD